MGVNIAVAYKNIARKGESSEAHFGHNDNPGVCSAAGNVMLSAQRDVSRSLRAGLVKDRCLSGS